MGPRAITRASEVLTVAPFRKKRAPFRVGCRGVEARRQPSLQDQDRGRFAYAHPSRISWGDLDLIAHHHAAFVERAVPADTELLPVDDRPRGKPARIFGPLSTLPSTTASTSSRGSAPRAPPAASRRGGSARRRPSSRSRRCARDNGSRGDARRRESPRT